jgi:hypothetical protein
MALILSGDAGITFPVVAGSASAVQASSGRVLQVVSANLSVEQSTTSSSFVTTTLAASITPSSTSSKIYIIVNGNLDCDSSQTATATIYRGATNLGNGNAGLGAVYGSGRVIASIGISYLDSPATTSATTYTVYYRAGSSATIRWSQGASTSTITLMEIAA